MTWVLNGFKREVGLGFRMFYEAVGVDTIIGGYEASIR